MSSVVGCGAAKRRAEEPLPSARVATVARHDMQLTIPEVRGVLGRKEVMEGRGRKGAL